MKTTTWTCDSCGMEISDVGHGWVEWLVKKEGNNYRPHSFRIVHDYPHGSNGGEGGCQYGDFCGYDKDGSTLSDTELRTFTGPGGLMDLLSMLSEEGSPKEELIELIKRIHIPGYEATREYFQEAIAEGIFEPNTKEGFYNMSDIEATLEWIKQRD